MCRHKDGDKGTTKEEGCRHTHTKKRQMKTFEPIKVQIQALGQNVASGPGYVLLEKSENQLKVRFLYGHCIFRPIGYKELFSVTSVRS